MIRAVSACDIMTFALNNNDICFFCACNFITNSIIRSSVFYLHNNTASTNHSLKRKSIDTTDGSLQAAALQSSRKKKPLTNERREERNMREKERSLKITQQIHELRNLLSSGGVIVPKVS